jgi:hypothetical protein
MAESQGKGMGQANLERGFEFSRLQDQWMATAYAWVVAPRRCVRRPPPERSRAALDPGRTRWRRMGGQSA